MSLIWATRGRHWGFRFVYGGGFDDPLVEYDQIFGNVGPDDEVFVRIGDRAALRFPDPLDRTDRAGRVIPHEFVLDSSIASGVAEARKCGVATRVRLLRPDLGRGGTAGAAVRVSQWCSCTGPT